MKEYRQQLLSRVMTSPASLCPEEFHRFTVRGDNVNTIEWDTDTLIDEGISINSLRDLAVILENRKELRGII